MDYGFTGNVLSSMFSSDRKAARKQEQTYMAEMFKMAQQEEAQRFEVARDMQKSQDEIAKIAHEISIRDKDRKALYEEANGMMSEMNQTVKSKFNGDAVRWYMSGDGQRQISAYKNNILYGSTAKNVKRNTEQVKKYLSAQASIKDGKEEGRLFASNGVQLQQFLSGETDKFVYAGLMGEIDKSYKQRYDKNHTLNGYDILEDNEDVIRANYAIEYGLSSDSAIRVPDNVLAKYAEDLYINKGEKGEADIVVNVGDDIYDMYEGGMKMQFSPQALSSSKNYYKEFIQASTWKEFERYGVGKSSPEGLIGSPQLFKNKGINQVLIKATTPEFDSEKGYIPDGSYKPADFFDSEGNRVDPVLEGSPAGWLSWGTPYKKWTKSTGSMDYFGNADLHPKGFYIVPAVRDINDGGKVVLIREFEEGSEEWVNQQTVLRSNNYKVENVMVSAWADKDVTNADDWYYKEVILDRATTAQIGKSAGLDTYLSQMENIDAQERRIFESGKKVGQAKVHSEYENLASHFGYEASNTESQQIVEAFANRIVPGVSSIMSHNKIDDNVSPFVVAEAYYAAVKEVEANNGSKDDIYDTFMTIIDSIPNAILDNQTGGLTQYGSLLGKAGNKQDFAKLLKTYGYGNEEIKNIINMGESLNKLKR